MPVERKHCQCHDTQTHFLERAFELLQLETAQRELLLSAFRETPVSIPLRPHRACPMSRQRNTDLRTAAYELAIGRVNQAMALRGF